MKRPIILIILFIIADVYLYFHPTILSMTSKEYIFQNIFQNVFLNTVATVILMFILTIELGFLIILFTGVLNMFGEFLKGEYK